MSDYALTYTVGVAENKNSKYRKTMEDVHTYVENFVSRLDWGYFAIFDGHAGKQASKWCGSNLHSLIESKILQDERRDVREVLNDAFVEADSDINATVEGSSGCTAGVAVLRWELPDDVSDADVSLQQHKRMLYTANVGDSRLVLHRGGKAVRLSYDHKASDTNEMARVENADGIVMKSRVNGMLAVTRSLGDKFFENLVIANPYTTCVELGPSDEFLIIACDGLWDVITDQEACELITGITDADEAAQVLVKNALELGTTDNITVIVVMLKHQQEFA